MAESKELRLIAFRAGPETFVLDIMAVRQIVPYNGSTSVPSAPSFVEGVIVVLGEVIPVIDLSKRLYPRVTKRSDQPLVLITQSPAGSIALRVDEVRRIITVVPEALLPPPEIVRGIRGELLIAIIPVEAEVFLLIDLDSVLTTEEKEELQSAGLSSSSGAAAGTSER